MGNRFRSLGCLAVAVLTACVFLVGVAAAAEQKSKATVKIPLAAELYAVDPQPLTVGQCGQCHSSVFKDLKGDGGLHRFDCQQCHQSFHSYNPRRNNWDAIMPQCATCHAQPHGKAASDCASCHANPHTPKKIAATPRLIALCTECHKEPQEQLVKNPSKHGRVACQKCHTSHGYKPDCSACHKPHHEGQAFSTCSGCHPVHRPLQITYGKDVPAVSCGACHQGIFAKWQKSPSKHAGVSCASCHHNRHRYVPQCTECHPKPHPEGFLKRFPKCLTCHLDAHDPPVKRGSAQQP